MTAAGLLVRIAAAATLAACSGTFASTDAADSTGLQPLTARDAVGAQLERCTQTHGYDPNSVAGVGEHELAPNERAWRQCAYDAIRAYTRSNPSVAGPCDQLILEDITMTSAIEAGTMTRSQRQERIEALVAQIEVAEADQLRPGASGQTMPTEQKQFLVDSLRSLR